MLNEKTKALLRWPLLFMPVICLVAGCQGASKKAPEPPAASEVAEAKDTVSAKEEDSAALTRQLEAARQARQREQEEATKQFEEARARLEEKIAALSEQLRSSAPAATPDITQRRREVPGVKPRPAEPEEQRAAALRERQAVKQVPAGSPRAADLAKQFEPATPASPPVGQRNTKIQEPAPAPRDTLPKTQEPPRPRRDGQGILDRLSSVAPTWVWIGGAILVVMLLYLMLRPSTLSKDKGKT
jgi:hypothetical protein